MRIEIGRVCRVMVVSLAAFVIAGPVSAVTIPSSGDDEEMVLMDTEESGVLDGLLYIVTCSLFGLISSCQFVRQS